MSPTASTQRCRYIAIFSFNVHHFPPDDQQTQLGPQGISMLNPPLWLRRQEAVHQEILIEGEVTTQGKALLPWSIPLAH